MEKYRFYFQDMDATGHPLHKLRYDVDGWKSYGVTFGRETNISNVVKSYTNSWTFIKNDADYLKQRMLLHGPNRRIRLIVQRLTDALAGSYEEEYAGYIDLTQSKWDFNTFTAPVNEGGFFTQLENKWDTDFSMKHNSVLDFTGNTLSVDADFESSETFTKGVVHDSSIGYFLIGQELKDTDNGQGNVFSTVHPRYEDAYFNPNSMDTLPATDTFYTNWRKSDAFLRMNNGGLLDMLSINARIRFSITGNPFRITVDNATYRGRCRLYVFAAKESAFDSNNQFTPIPYQNCDCYLIGTHNYTITVPEYETIYNELTIPIEFDMYNNTTLVNQDYGNEMVFFYLVLRVEYGYEVYYNGIWDNRYPIEVYRTPNDDKTFITTSDVEINIGYTITARLNYEIGTSVIPVVDVFKRLIEKVNDGRYNVGVSTQMLEQFADGDVIASGGGLRAVMSDPMLGSGVYPSRLDITTSLAKFLQFVYVCYGLKFCVDYDRNSDTYKCYLNTINGIFSANQITRLEKISDLSFAVDREKLYSKITAGYAVDDDVLMGRSEFNCTNTYSTPNTEIEENELSLESPYSAASFSIDTYILLNYGNLEDSSNEDGKIYVMSCKKVSEQYVGQAGMWMWGADVVKRYELSRDIQVDSGIAYPDTAFNVKFSPKRLLLRHSKELDSYMAFNAGGAVKLEVCEYNKDLESGGIVEADDYVIGGHPLFYPVIITLNAAARERMIALIESNRCGYFTFDANGFDVRGFIADDSGAVTVNPMNEQASEFKLLAKSLNGII